MSDLHIEDIPVSSNNQGAPDKSGHFIIASDGGVQPLPVDSEFAYRDGNIELQTPSRRFWVHEFLLTKFARITELIRQGRDRGDITPDPERRVIIRVQNTEKVQCLDFQNTFRVIYSSFISGPAPPTFDTEILVSTLRVATLFQNPDLRNFAISQLDSKKKSTAAIDRIALSDDLNLPGWEIPAFTELCRRLEPISVKEANILGINRFVEIARMREAEQRRQYIGLVKQLAADPLLDANGAVVEDKLKAVAEQTLKHATLPACDCHTQNRDSDRPETPAGNFGKYMPDPYDYSIQQPRKQKLASAPKKSQIIKCQLHGLAQSIASESRTLYNHLSRVLGRARSIIDSASALRHSLPSDYEDYSLESELTQASWVRKVE